MCRHRRAVECNRHFRHHRFLLLWTFFPPRCRKGDLDSAPRYTRGDSSGMVKRTGIGASAVTAIIFSVLLVSNFTVFMAAQDRQRLYIQADAENSLSSDALVLGGVGAMNLLGTAQDYLATTGFNCATAVQSSMNMLASLYDVERTGRLTVVTSASLAPGVDENDNMSMLKPFDGSQSGYVDISLRISSSGSYTSPGVSLERTESHLVHLPVRLEALASICSMGVRTLEASLEGSRPSNCTTSAVAPILSRASAGPAGMASSAGFAFGVSYAMDDSVGCSVHFNLDISQNGIEGPHGSFSVRMQEGGFADLRLVVPRQA